MFSRPIALKVMPVPCWYIVISVSHSLFIFSCFIASFTNKFKWHFHKNLPDAFVVKQMIDLSWFKLALGFTFAFLDFSPNITNKFIYKHAYQRMYMAHSTHMQNCIYIIISPLHSNHFSHQKLKLCQNTQRLKHSDVANEPTLFCIECVFVSLNIAIFISCFCQMIGKPKRKTWIIRYNDHSTLTCFFSSNANRM